MCYCHENPIHLDTSATATILLNWWLLHDALSRYRNPALLRRPSVDPPVNPDLVRDIVSKHRTPRSGNLLSMFPPTSPSVIVRQSFSARIVRVPFCSSVRRRSRLLPQSPNRVIPASRSSVLSERRLKLLIRDLLCWISNFPRTRKQREEAKTLRSRIRQPLPLPLTRTDGIDRRF